MRKLFLQDAHQLRQRWCSQFMGQCHSTNSAPCCTMRQSPQRIKHYVAINTSFIDSHTTKSHHAIIDSHTTTSHRPHNNSTTNYKLQSSTDTTIRLIQAAIKTICSSNGSKQHVQNSVPGFLHGCSTVHRVRLY